MYPVIVNPTKNHSLLLYSFTRAFTGVNFRPNFDKRSGVMMPGSRGGGGGGGPESRDFFFFWGGGGGIEGVRTPSPKPWFVHGNYTEDFQNERKNALEIWGGPESRDFFFFGGGGGEGVELRGSGPQVPNPGLCMVIILKIFKMKEKMRWRSRHIAR